MNGQNIGNTTVFRLPDGNVAVSFNPNSSFNKTNKMQNTNNKIVLRFGKDVNFFIAALEVLWPNWNRTGEFSYMKKYEALDIIKQRATAHSRSPFLTNLAIGISLDGDGERKKVNVFVFDYNGFNYKTYADLKTIDDKSAIVEILANALFTNFVEQKPSQETRTVEAISFDYTDSYGIKTSNRLAIPLNHSDNATFCYDVVRRDFRNFINSRVKNGIIKSVILTLDKSVWSKIDDEIANN